MLPPRLWHVAALLAVTAVLAPAIGAADPGEPGAARTPLYQWTAEDGGIRYTPDPSRIPESRRQTQRRIDPSPAPARALPSPLPTEARSELPDPLGSSEPALGPSGPVSAAPSGRTEARSCAAPGPSPHQGRWAVQILATPLEQAVSLPPLALRAGERLYRSTAKVDGALWSRLRVGTFPTRAGAQEAVSRLAREFPGAWITRVAPGEDLPPVMAGSANSESPEATTSDALDPQPRAAAAASSVDGVGRYAIQLRAIPASEEPEPLPALVPPPGSQLYWTSVERDDESWHRLRLGDFPNLATARAALALVAREFPGAWIAPIRGSRDRLDSGPIDRSR